MAITLVFALLFTLPAHADSAAKPSEIEALIKAEKPLGEATLRWAIVKIYDASLWTDAPHWSYENPFALSVVYDITMDGEGLLDRTISEMNDVKKLDEATEAQYRTAFAGHFPDVKPGDRITSYYKPTGQIDFFYNGKSQGSIEGKAFTRHFMDIWMSPKTNAPEVRESLLKTQLADCQVASGC